MQAHAAVGEPDRRAGHVEAPDPGVRLVGRGDGVVPVVLEVIAERLRSLRLVDGQRLTFFPNITFRGPDELLVEWDG